MYRTHDCGELRLSDSNTKVTLCGWVQKSRDKGFMVWIDLRDRYGITQLIFDEQRSSKELFNKAKSIGREFIIPNDWAKSPIIIFEHIKITYYSIDRSIQANNQIFESHHP